jgi:hypothetical protein
VTRRVGGESRLPRSAMSLENEADNDSTQVQFLPDQMMKPDINKNRRMVSESLKPDGGRLPQQSQRP